MEPSVNCVQPVTDASSCPSVSFTFIPVQVDNALHASIWSCNVGCIMLFVTELPLVKFGLCPSDLTQSLGKTV